MYLENLYKLVLVGLLISGAVIVAVLLVPFMAASTPEEAVECKNLLPDASMNLEVLKAGNYSYQNSVRNPYDNASIKVYSFLLTDPPELIEYVSVFECTIKNGTKLLPLDSAYAFFELTVDENPFQTEGTYYIRVGCLREGEDF